MQTYVFTKCLKRNAPMKKCYLCKFPYDEFFKCNLEDNDNIFDCCIKCAKFEALNNKDFKLLNENKNTEES